MASVFFATLASSRGDFADAFQHGLIVALCFVLAALAVAVTDIVVERRSQHGKHEPETVGTR